MAYHVKTNGYAGLAKDGTSKYYVDVMVDTAADIPNPAEHPEWEIGSELVVLENGGSKYQLSNAREWVQVNFDEFAEGGDVSALQEQVEEAITQIAEVQEEINTLNDTIGSMSNGSDAYGMPTNDLASGVDLNNLCKTTESVTGSYRCKNASIAASLVNSPITDRPFRLDVIVLGKDKYRPDGMCDVLMQRIIAFEYGIGSVDVYCRIRTVDDLDNTVWGSWMKCSMTAV